MSSLLSKNRVSLVTCHFLRVANFHNVFSVNFTTDRYVADHHAVEYTILY